jgi:hypothetical protein
VELFAYVFLNTPGHDFRVRITTHPEIWFCDKFGGTEDIGNPTADQVKSFKPQAPNSQKAPNSKH